MAGSFFRRSATLPFMANPTVSPICKFYSQVFNSLYRAIEKSPSTSCKSRNVEFGPTSTSSDHSSMMHLSPLLSSERDNLEHLDILLVDADLWQVSSGIAHASGVTDGMPRKSPLEGMAEREEDDSPTVKDDHDFDEIEDMRLHGNLFYKLDRDSREFEEYNINFHRKKSAKKKEKLKHTAVGKESTSKEKINNKSPSAVSKIAKHKSNGAPFQEIYNSRVKTGSFVITAPSAEGKKIRSPTYNQLTDPYHLPFCLDIFISKSSVRACIVHRATSKVVVVAHSISKDMKYELASTKDSTACAAVGRVLAERAIADDIHNVVYTPRKGEKLEGKLQIVLQSIIDNGIDVKVKLKQKRPDVQKNSAK